MAGILDPQSFMVSLGEVVRNARKAAGLTQLELADLAGIGKSAVFDLEKGKVNVQMSTVLSVLRVLNIELRVHAPVDLSGKEGRSR